MTLDTSRGSAVSIGRSARVRPKKKAETWYMPHALSFISIVFSFGNVKMDVNSNEKER